MIVVMPTSPAPPRGVRGGRVAGSPLRQGPSTIITTITTTTNNNNININIDITITTNNN